MGLREDLEQKQEEAEALGKLTLEEKKTLAGKSEQARKNAIIALSKKYGRVLEDIREIEMDIAEEEGRELPEELTTAERQMRESEFREKVQASFKSQVTQQMESSAEGAFRAMRVKAGSKTTLYDVLEKYLKEAVPFNPETNNIISIAQMFKKKYDEIAVKNLVTLEEEYEKRLDIAETLTGSAGVEIDNFTHNFQLLQDAMEDKRGSQADFSLEGSYSINVGKYFGAINLSDSESRDLVYDYWKAIDAKYEDFTNALEAFLESAENTKNEAFANRVRKFRDKYERGAEGKFNLRYVYDVAPMPTPRVPAKQRLVQVIENIIATENLSNEVERIFTPAKAGEEDVTTDELTEQLSGYKETFSDAMEMDLRQTYLEDILEPVPEDEDDERFIDNLLEDTVDILLATEMMRSKRLISATEDAAIALRQYLDMVVDLLPEKRFKSIETYIDRFKDEIKNSLILERQDYFIPVSVLIQPQVKNQLKGGAKAGVTPDEAEEEIENISEFFEDLETLLKDWENQTILEVAPSGRPPATSIEPREDPTGKVSRLLSASAPTIAGKRTSLPEYLKDQRETLKVLVESIIEYYVNPIYSGRMPVSIPAFANKLGFKDVLVLAGQLGADTTTGKEYMRATAESISSLEVDDIRDLRQFFSRVFSKNVKPNVELIGAAKSAINALTKLFGNQEANANYISAVLLDIMRNTGDMALAERTIKTKQGRKNILERAGLYQDAYLSNKAFPIFGLPLYLDMNEGLFYNHPNNQMKSEYDSLVNVLKETGDDLPVMLKALLEAHDEIRKALGKEVQYGFVPLSYEAITKFLVEENIDLTTFEVENIVKSYDSHKSIGTEYGIGSDNVYLIKANFR